MAEVNTAGRTSRVLIVDDENRLREMLTRSVAELGFTPVAAKSAEQAVKCMESDEDIGIALLDLNLPGMDGLDLLQKIRDRWPNTQAIILTGFGSLEAAKRAIRLDAIDFLTKPCSLGDLEAALARAHQRRQSWLRDSTIRSVSLNETLRREVPQIDSAMSLEDLERVHILAALDRHDGNRAAAAAELGISERTLYYRLEQYHRQND